MRKLVVECFMTSSSGWRAEPRHRSPLRLLTPWALCLAVACGGDSPDPLGQDAGATTPAVRDSAGVAIVEHAADVLDRAPRVTLADSPSTTLRGSQSSIPLTMFAHPLLLADGRLVLMADDVVAIFNPDGTLAKQIGRQGSGPAEFRSGQLVRGLADTLLVQDNGNRRVAFLVPDRGVIRTRPFSSYRGRNGFAVVGQFGADGLLLATSGVQTTSDTGALAEVPWLGARVEAGRDSIVVVTSVPGFALVMHDGSPTPRRYAGLPMVTAWDDKLLTIDGREWTLDVRGADGQLLRSIRVPLRPRRLDPDTVAADNAAQLQYLRDNWATMSHRGAPLPDMDAVARSLQRAPVSDTMAAIQRVLVGADGTVWVKDGGYYLVDASWAWTGVARDGRLVRRLVGSGPDRIVAFGAGSVLLKEEDDDGFALFRVHRLVGGTPQI